MCTAPHRFSAPALPPRHRLPARGNHKPASQQSIQAPTAKAREEGARARTILELHGAALGVHVRHVEVVLEQDRRLRRVVHVVCCSFAASGAQPPPDAASSGTLSASCCQPTSAGGPTFPTSTGSTTHKKPWNSFISSRGRRLRCLKAVAACACILAGSTCRCTSSGP